MQTFHGHLLGHNKKILHNSCYSWVHLRYEVEERGGEGEGKMEGRDIGSW